MSRADEPLLIGRVARAHGNRGQVIVNPETDFAEKRFAAGRVLLVGSGDTMRARSIREVRFQTGRPILTLEGIETMDDAEGLAGAELRVRAEDVEPLPAGTYYHHDLLGCQVRDTADALIGEVTAIEGTMEQSRLVVRGARGDVLIPLAAEICVEVDPPARRIVVRPPEGLIELNETRRQP